MCCFLSEDRCDLNSPGTNLEILKQKNIRMKHRSFLLDCTKFYWAAVKVEQVLLLTEAFPAMSGDVKRNQEVAI